MGLSLDFERLKTQTETKKQPSEIIKNIQKSGVSFQMQAGGERKDIPSEITSHFSPWSLPFQVSAKMHKPFRTGFFQIRVSNCSLLAFPIPDFLFL